MTRLFKIKSSTVHDTFGDETIVVNLDTGAYYSAQGSASVIWQLIKDGLTERSILEHFSSDISASENVSEATATFFEQLVTEKLVEAEVIADDAASSAGAGQTDRSKTFSPPVLQKYTDMEEMLLLDPVHEVDENGWPTTRKQLD